MQRSDGPWDYWEPGPVARYVQEWASYWWSLRPRPPQEQFDDGEWVLKDKKWIKKEKGHK